MYESNNDAAEEALRLHSTFDVVDGDERYGLT